MAKSKTVALMIESRTAYGRGILRGIARYARSHTDWQIEFNPNRESIGIRYHGVPAVDGMIARMISEDIEQTVVESGVPTVNISAFRKSSLPSVCPDNRAIGRLAARHLLERGFSHLAAFGTMETHFANERIAGFAEVAHELGVTCHIYRAEELGQPGLRLEEPGGLEPVSPWLDSLPKPIGVLAVNDWLAMELTERCRQLAIRVPEDLAVVGVDNDEVICELANPPLSSIRLPTEQIGYEAAKLLRQIMSGKASTEQPRTFEPLDVIVRRSSDVLAIEDPLVADAARYIWDHACDGIRVSDVSRHVGVSRRWLEVRFREALGRSPAVEIRRVQMDKAKKLLVETDLLLTDVAGAAGMQDAKLLVSVFRRELNCTPNAYRRKFRVT